MIFKFSHVFVCLGPCRTRYKSGKSKLLQCNDQTLLPKCMFIPLIYCCITFEILTSLFRYISISNDHPQLSASLGVGLQYTKHEKLRYFLRAKKGFPATSDGLLSFNIKGRFDVDKEFKQVDVLFKLYVILCTQYSNLNVYTFLLLLHLLFF